MDGAQGLAEGLAAGGALAAQELFERVFEALLLQLLGFALERRGGGVSGVRAGLFERAAPQQPLLELREAAFPRAQLRDSRVRSPR